MKKYIEFKNLAIISTFLITLILCSCGANKNQEAKDDYQKVLYTELENNDNASLEILNQINFISKQLGFKEKGKHYVSTNAENIITLSKIPAKVTALGTLGKSYELTRENLSKWEKWYKENSKYIYYEVINGEKFIAIKYPNGEKIVLDNNSSKSD
jgi:hypothetical protein